MDLKNKVIDVIPQIEPYWSEVANSSSLKKFQQKPHSLKPVKFQNTFLWYQKAVLESL